MVQLIGLVLRSKIYLLSLQENIYSLWKLITQTIQKKKEKKNLHILIIS